MLITLLLVVLALIGAWLLQCHMTLHPLLRRLKCARTQAEFDVYVRAIAGFLSANRFYAFVLGAACQRYVACVQTRRRFRTTYYVGGAR